MSTEDTNAARRGSESNDLLGARTEPTAAEDRAFWSFLIIAQIWAASDLTGWPRWLVSVPWMALAVLVRWPYWRRTWLRRDGA